ncbi:homeobox protein PKNOX1.1 isoform X5 [Pygocentrus nattereri]|uniref:homeobox protein PKNOX1.1 isoform X5 n=1 Tax=Pygocentrus nattereri TaxID=42514 RepID=UPI0008149D50|nr:homeobox protein PKNOX1.1 isoform X5 [Pygocentrus nattereri]
MMAAQPVSLDKYQEGVQQMQGMEQTDGDPEKSFADSRICSPALTKPQTPMDTDKASIYRHPLFPLLALLFEKCEQSTQGPECVSSASFDVDIENFVRSQEKDSKTFFSEDPELDNLTPSFSSTMSPQGIVVPASALQHGSVTMTTANTQQVLAGPPGSTVYQPVTVLTPEGHVVTQGLSPSTLRFQNSQQLQLQLNQDLSFFSADESSSKNKRGVLPKHATNVMRSWLFQHIGHPYPTEEEKKQIASQTNLTLLQVNNWFINARRRILQPMLDASSAETPKTKKKTPQNRPLQRFWPDTIASSLSQQQLTMADGTMVTVGMSIDGFQTLSADGAILAVQQVMMGDQSEEETNESGDEDDTHLSSASMTALGLDPSD